MAGSALATVAVGRVFSFRSSCASVVCGTGLVIIVGSGSEAIAVEEETDTDAGVDADDGVATGAEAGAGDCFCIPDNSNPNTEKPVDAAEGGGVAGGTNGIDEDTATSDDTAAAVDVDDTGVTVSWTGDGGGMTATAGIGKGRGIIAIGGGLLALVLPLLPSAVMVAGGVGNDERAGDACADPALPNGGGAVTFLLSMLMMDRPCTPLPVGRMSGRGGNACKSSRDTTVKKRGRKRRERRGKAW